MNKTGKASTNPFSKHGVPWVTREQHGNTPQKGGLDTSQPNIMWGSTPYTTNQASQTTYQPALTDGGWPKAGGADGPIAQSKETGNHGNPVIEQSTLKAWIDLIKGVTSVVGTASVTTLGKAASGLAGDVGKSINMVNLIGGATRAEQNRKPHNPPRITDNNIGEFAITGAVSTHEIKEQKIREVRERLKALKARLNQAEQAITNGNPQVQNVVQEVLANPQVANKIAGPKKFITPKKLGPYDLALYRTELKKAKEKIGAQQALPMPKGRETGPNLFRIGKPRKQAHQVQHLMAETGVGKGGTINIGQ